MSRRGREDVDALLSPQANKRFVLVVGAGGVADLGMPTLAVTRSELPERPPAMQEIAWRQECGRRFVDLLSEPVRRIREEHRIPAVMQWCAALRQRRCVVTIVTTNVDGLLTGAIELHGSIWRTRCYRCRSTIGECLCTGTEKVIGPDLVLVGDREERREEAIARLQEADTVVVMGLRGVGVGTWNLIASAGPRARIVRIDPHPDELWEAMRLRVVYTVETTVDEYVRLWMHRHSRRDRRTGLTTGELYVPEAEQDQEGPRTRRRTEEQVVQRK